MSFAINEEIYHLDRVAREGAKKARDRDLNMRRLSMPVARCRQIMNINIERPPPDLAYSDGGQCHA
jgi:hypothetical protein